MKKNEKLICKNCGINFKKIGSLQVHQRVCKHKKIELIDLDKSTEIQRINSLFKIN